MLLFQYFGAKDVVVDFVTVVVYNSMFCTLLTKIRCEGDFEEGKADAGCRDRLVRVLQQYSGQGLVLQGASAHAHPSHG